MAERSAALAPVPVTFVAGQAGHGGSERYLEALLTALGSEWVDRVITLEHGPLVAQLRSRGIEVRAIAAPGKAGVAFGAGALARELRRRPAALIHANGIKAALVSALATPRGRAPILWVKHDFSWDGPLARAVARRCRQVVAVSSALTATFGERRHTPPVHVVPAGLALPHVDRRAARARLRALVEAPENAPVVTMVGQLRESKGQVELLEVVPALLRRFPDLRVCFVGADYAHEPAYGPALRERASVLGLGGAVVAAGHRDDSVELIAGSDATILASLPDHRGRGREGSPLVAIEALAVGCPVVAYSHGGIPDVLGNAGRLVPAGDRQALTETLSEVLADERLRTRLTEAGRERYSRRNRPEAMAAAMIGLYRDAAA